MNRIPFRQRLFRVLLRLFPSEFRGDFGPEMTQAFEDERRDAAAAGRTGRAGFWWRTVRGMAMTGPREHASVMLRDAGYGLRLMRAHPGVTLTALLTIALGVGANTAMFSVVNGVLFKVPFHDPDRLVTVRVGAPGSMSAAITVSQFETWRDRVRAFDGITGFTLLSPVLTGHGEATRLAGECVSAEAFAILDGTPVIGRPFTASEDRAGQPLLAVIGHDLWTTRLGGDASIVGRTIALDQEPVTVVGIAGPTFGGPHAYGRTNLWMPLAPCLDRLRAQGRRAQSVNVYGRLAGGVTLPVAAAEMESALERDATAAPDGQAVQVELAPLLDELIGDVREPLLALLGAAGFVLLIASANVASLLLGRAHARRKELAVRAALGCSRARIVRQLLTESLVFGITGGALGLLVANWILGTILAMRPASVPGLHRVGMDWRVLAVCLFASLGTGLLFGLLPAITGAHVSPAAALGEFGRGAAGSARQRARSALVIAEIALSLALLVGAGLLTRTFLHLRPDNPGFKPDGKLIVTVTLPRAPSSKSDSSTAFFDQFFERLRSQPVFAGVSASSTLPLTGNVRMPATVAVAGHPLGRRPNVDMPVVTANYFDEIGMAILRGRGFSRDDSSGSQPVTVINETMARRFWPAASPLGAYITAEERPGLSVTRTVVGIVNDVRGTGNRLGAFSQAYVPWAQGGSTYMTVVLRTDEPAERVAPIIQSQMAALNPNLPVESIEPLNAVLSRSVSLWRFAAWVMSLFAGLAVVLASVGLFAVVGWSVTERTREIGVRMALGASRSQILSLIARRALVWTALGLALGLGLAVATTRFLASWMVDVSPLDRTTFAAAAGLMAVVALTAAYVPARRATKVDPLVTLRAE